MTHILEQARGDGWEVFNWRLIIQEAKARHQYALECTAPAITTEMRTLEYWTAWCAHANLLSALPLPPKEEQR